MFIKKVDTFYNSNLDGLIFIQKKKFFIHGSVSALCLIYRVQRTVRFTYSAQKDKTYIQRECLDQYETLYPQQIDNSNNQKCA